MSKVEGQGYIQRNLFYFGGEEDSIRKTFEGPHNVDHQS